MQIDAFKKVSEPLVSKLVLTAVGPDDQQFLTRLHKAIVLNDAIMIDMGTGENMVYHSGGTQEVEWKPDI